MPAFNKVGQSSFYGKWMHGINGDIQFNSSVVVKETRYTANVLDNYFYYCLNERNKLDHGIIGADELFSKLVINYFREYRKIAIKKSFNGSFADFHNKEGLHFCSEHFKVFAYIADCVASHNIFMSYDTMESKMIYEQYFLDCLEYGKFNRIAYIDNPLLFILCVADTIEPSKRFSGHDNEYILKHVIIDYNAENNFLHIKIDESLYLSKEGRKYKENIEELMTWCDIDTEVEIY